MGNQQVDQLELGWLAGAFDADGHMFMKTYNTKRGSNSRIEIGFTNTDRSFLCKVLSICKRLGVNLYVQEKSLQKKYWSRAWVVRTGKQTLILKLLEQLIPMLTVKRERAEILHAFCHRRNVMADELCDGNIMRLSRLYPYNSEDIWFFDKFNELNKRPTPTTIPSGSRTQGSPKCKTQSIRLDCDDIV